MKPQKCSFCQTSVDFLGHTVSEDGVRCSNKHLEAVSAWPEPSNVSDLQTFFALQDSTEGLPGILNPGLSHVKAPKR